MVEVATLRLTQPATTGLSAPKDCDLLVCVRTDVQMSCSRLVPSYLHNPLRCRQGRSLRSITELFKWAGF